MKMRAVIFSVATAALFTLSCTTTKKMQDNKASAFDYEAHRGGRGLMPENTIPAMLHAIDLGVTTLEMDAMITKDNQVIVSHDPYFNELITTTPEGKYLTKKEATERLIYSMPYDSVKKYDVGSKPHPDFPHQQKMKVSKPLLSDLIDAAEAHAREKGLTIHYNIEIKSKEGYDGIRHPDPGTFSDLLINVIKSKGTLDRTIIQSFDVRALQYMHKTYPKVTLSYLVEKTSTPLQELLDKLGFVPEIYSPNSANVTKELVTQCHQKGMKVIPWTVNTVDEMKAIKATGADGIISDYPDLFAQIK